ncbi:Gfo/Idh/MocA family oxidoreductase [Patescibacteria group bacterium]|nr:Gfo/Idh/MocA family oxidoreductase [Patescibacteria group bacterium]
MRYAIIGFGKMGKLYDRLLNADFIVDLISIQSKIYFSNLEEFLYYHPQVDLVIVATPTRTHYQIVKKLLESNYNVLCEKPLCLFVHECKKLEKLAEKKKLILYQSTLERFNPVIKFINKNFNLKNVNKVTSIRFGKKPFETEGVLPVYDLGIHDVDLWFYLFNKKVIWEVYTGYGDKKREIKLYLNDNSIIVADLLNKKVTISSKVINLASEMNNPILEMIDYIKVNKLRVNEKWSEQIDLLRLSKDNVLILEPL